MHKRRYCNALVFDCGRTSQPHLFVKKNKATGTLHRAVLYTALNGFRIHALRIRAVEGIYTRQ